MTEVKDSGEIEPPSELQAVELHGHQNDIYGLDRTLMYGGAFFEDIHPLATQGRLDVRFNDTEYRPTYISINERVSRQRVPMDDSVPKNVDGIEDDDMVLRETSVGFEIEVHINAMLGPYDLGDGGMGPKCYGLSFIGVHEEWSSQKCQIVDYGLGVNNDGNSELSFQIDKFNRSER